MRKEANGHIMIMKWNPFLQNCIMTDEWSQNSGQKCPNMHI
jgi:hypothetical protein